MKLPKQSFTKYPVLSSLINNWYENTSHVSISALMKKAPEYKMIIDYSLSNKNEFAYFCIDYLNDIGGSRMIYMLIHDIIGIPSMVKDNYVGPEWRSTVKIYKKICQDFLNGNLKTDEADYII